MSEVAKKVFWNSILGMPYQPDPSRPSPGDLEKITVPYEIKLPYTDDVPRTIGLDGGQPTYLVVVEWQKIPRNCSQTVGHVIHWRSFPIESIFEQTFDAAKLFQVNKCVMDLGYQSVYIKQELDKIGETAYGKFANGVLYSASAPGLDLIEKGDEFRANRSNWIQFCNLKIKGGQLRIPQSLIGQSTLKTQILNARMIEGMNDHLFHCLIYACMGLQILSDVIDNGCGGGCRPITKRII